MPEQSPFPARRDGSDDRAERALRAALAAQADDVHPGAAPRVADLLDRSRGLDDRRRTRRWPAALGVAAGVAALAVASTLALRPETAAPLPAAIPAVTATAIPTQDGSTPAPTAEGTAVPAPLPSPTAPATTEPAPPTTDAPGGPGGGTGDAEDPGPGTEPGTVIVWATVLDPRTGSGRLVPERRPVDLPVGADTQDKVSAAVTLLASTAPTDPEHVSGWFWDAAAAGGTEPWDGGTPVPVDITGSGTTVDLPAAAARAPLGSLGAQTAVDELVRTVVSNGGTAPVTILVGGRPDAELWGAVGLDGPVVADPDLLTGGWVLDPYEGQRVAAGAVRISGTATAFEANVLWEVTHTDGGVVAEGFTMAGANGVYGPFSFTVDLVPGRYTVTVREASMVGEGEPDVWHDSTRVTVVP